MNGQSNWVRILVGSMVALLVLIGGTLLFPLAASAANETTQTISQNGDGAFTRTHWGRGGPRGAGLSVDDTYLAEALGITVEELQTARDEALEAALQAAVNAGLITQAQADRILENGGWGHRRFGQAIDYDTYLAEALGISVEELEAAEGEAREAAIADAVEEGTITQEQADLLLAYSAVKEAIDQNPLTATALGMSVEEYEAAVAEGTSLSDLLDEAGMTIGEFRTAREAAYQATVQALVDDGTITQEQADQILSGGFGFGRGFGCPFGGPPQDTVTPSIDA